MFLWTKPILISVYICDDQELKEIMECIHEGTNIPEDIKWLHLRFLESQSEFQSFQLQEVNVIHAGQS